MKVFDNNEMHDEGYSQTILDELEAQGFTHIMFGGDEELQSLSEEWEADLISPSPCLCGGIESIHDGTWSIDDIRKLCSPIDNFERR